MELKDYIHVIENVLPHEVCDRLLAEYGPSEDWAYSKVGVANEVNRNIRSAQVIPMSTEGVINKNPKVRRELDNLVFEGASLAINKYAIKFPYSKIEQDSGYDLLRYREGEFYLEHTDSFKQHPRSVSCSFALNDDYDGGEFAFFNKQIKIKAPKGAALLFPSNFMYPHEILPVISGVRYSIVTWFI